LDQVWVALPLEGQTWQFVLCIAILHLSSLHHIVI
jgi:hypothetical protein